MKIIIPIVILFACSMTAHADSAWSRIEAPLTGPSNVIGFYSGGCIAGAEALPLAGAGYQVMRPSRNRYYGHPNLIAFVERLGLEAARRGKKLLIGDLAQPRGGPMNFGHRSHQSGLDADIWFRQINDGRSLTAQEAETLPMLSMITPAQASLNLARWSPAYRDSLKLAAESPEVTRIFVNPIIKQALCRSERGDRAWLRKLRPWWGHDAHFHVRLRCPPALNQCEDQAPIGSDEGCDEDLNRWVREIQFPPPKQKKPPPKPLVLPEACGAVLNGGR